MRTDRPLTLSVTEAGNLLGVSRSTAYELVRTGELESVQLRRRLVVPVAAVAARLGIAVTDVWLAVSTTGLRGSECAGPTDVLAGACTGFFEDGLRVTRPTQGESGPSQ